MKYYCLFAVYLWPPAILSRQVDVFS